jgi:hypothetical protein
MCYKPQFAKVYDSPQRGMARANRMLTKLVSLIWVKMSVGRRLVF